MEKKLTLRKFEEASEIVKKVKESEILVELKKMIMEDEKNEEDKGILGN